MKRMTICSDESGKIRVLFQDDDMVGLVELRATSHKIPLHRVLVVLKVVVYAMITGSGIVGFVNKFYEIGMNVRSILRNTSMQAPQ